MNYYLEVLKKYIVFEGRARREEYWYFVLFNFIASFLLVMVDLLFGTYNSQTQSGVFSSIYSLAVLLPSLAVTVRRLHDTDRSGWWVTFPMAVLAGGGILMAIILGGSQNAEELSPAASGILIVFVLAVLGSFIALFVFMVQDGTPGSNRFGDDPKNQPIPSPDYRTSRQNFSKKTVQMNRSSAVKLIGEGAAKTIELYPNRKVIIGRSPSADIQIDNQYVSGKHLSILLSDNGTVSATDLGSSNGTYVQGVKLATHTPHIVYPGDRIILGSEDVVYRL